MKNRLPRPAVHEGRPTPTRRLREATFITVGAGYDRDPCPHTLRAFETIPDPARPDDAHRSRLRVVETPCSRPGGHVREQRMIPDKHGETTVVPDDDARQHATEDGRVWS
jgi:hypothetical protein